MINFLVLVLIDMLVFVRNGFPITYVWRVWHRLLPPSTRADIVHEAHKLLCYTSAHLQLPLHTQRLQLHLSYHSLLAQVSRVEACWGGVSSGGVMWHQHRDYGGQPHQATGLHGKGGPSLGGGTQAPAKELASAPCQVLSKSQKDADKK